MNRLNRDKLLIAMRLKRFKKLKGGKEVYDYEGARGLPNSHRSRVRRRDPDELIRTVCDKYSWGANDLAKIVREVKGWPEGSVLKIIEPIDHPCGAVLTKEVFGDDKKESGLREEITDLVLKGEKLRDHQRRLQLKYHLYPDKIVKPGVKQEDRNRLVKDAWKQIEKEYTGYPAEVKRGILDWRTRIAQAIQADKAEAAKEKHKNAKPGRKPARA